MECSQTKNLLPAYLDDVLDATNTRRVEQHLAACPGCAAELLALRTTLAALSSLEKVAAPADFLDQVHARLERPSGLHRLLRMLFFPWRVKLPLELAGAIATALLVVLTYQQMKTTEGSLPAPAVMPTAPAARAILEAPAVTPEQAAPAPVLHAEADQAEPERPGAEKHPVVLALRLKSTAEHARLTAQSKANQQEQASVDKPARPSLSSPVATQEARPAGSAPAAPSPPGSAPGDTRMRAARSPAPRTDEVLRDQDQYSKDDQRFEAKGKTVIPLESLPEKHPEESLGGIVADQPAAVDGAKAGRRGPQTQGVAQRAKMQVARSREALAQVKNLVENAGGIILSEDQAFDTGHSQSLLAQIPAENFSRLLDQLRLMGELREPPPHVPAATRTEPIRVQIYFIASP